MHNNYFFLRQLSRSIVGKVLGSKLNSCFSQNKDELILEFKNGAHFYIKADLSSSFCCLSFPSDFSRARKNSVDLFSDLVERKVRGVRQFENERSFAIEFEQDWTLLFKMHETRSNVILFHHKRVHTIFRNHLKSDFEINIENLDREIDWTLDYFTNHLPSIKKKYFTFGKKIWYYLENNRFNSLDIDAKWDQVQKTLKQLHEPRFYISRLNGILTLLLFKEGIIVKEFSDPIEAINFFYHQRTTSDQFETEKRRIVKEFEDKIAKAEKYIDTNSKKLKDLTVASQYRQWGDLLMANLTHKPIHQNEILVSDFYHEHKTVTIPLKSGLSLQKNAELYYRKAKNQSKEIEKITESIRVKKEIISQMTSSMEELSAIDNIQSLKERFGKKKKSSAPPVLPFHIIQYNNYEILIGKNASSNDTLTFHHAKKNDLWLHAKDIAGSHVIIKHQSGSNFPKPVIERAAELAAYHSKRKNESLCPVSYTEKKYVRKRKGDPPGVVVVEKEKVILVKPRNF